MAAKAGQQVADYRIEVCDDGFISGFEQRIKNWLWQGCTLAGPLAVIARPPTEYDGRTYPQPPALYQPLILLLPPAPDTTQVTT